MWGSVQFSSVQWGSYVPNACNPKTFARDAAKFIELGWRIERLAPVDLFPGALHVETVAKFVRDAQPR